MVILRSILSGLVLFLAVSPALARAELSAEEVELKVLVDNAADEMVETLEAWVEMNTGTWHREGLERFAQVLVEALLELAFDVGVLPGPKLDLPGHEGEPTGPLLVAKRPAKKTPAPEFLLVGHYDTVFERDSTFQQFLVDVERPEVATGPGVNDMKGGIVVMLHALRALNEHGDLDHASWTVLFNTDEEIGSMGSRPRIEAEARQATIGFVFEAAHQGGAMVQSRRGLGQFHMAVEGVAAHAGSAHHEGRSAVHELAHKVIKIEALTDYDRGVTLNVGSFHGGTKRNIVPASAEVWIDLRYEKPEQAAEMRSKIELIATQSTVAGTHTRLWGRLHRPPKLATPKTLRLLELHEQVARSVGIELPPLVHAGGGTDGSLMAAVGLPTLDSLGVSGGRAHTEQEFVELTSLPRRAAIAAILFRRLMEPAHVKEFSR